MQVDPDQRRFRHPGTGQRRPMRTFACPAMSSTESPFRAQPQWRDFFLPQVQPDIPVELQTEIETHPVYELPKRCGARCFAVVDPSRGGEKRLVLLQRQRPQVNPELALMIPDTSSGNSAHAEALSFGAEIRPIASRENQPVADKLLEARGNAEVLANDRRQSVGVPHLAHERRNVKQLRDVGHRVALPQRRWREPNERADVGPIMIIPGSIPVDVWLRLGPGTIEERREAMMKEVEKPTERRIAGMTQAMPRVLRQVNRQRAIRTEQAEQPDLQSGRSAVFSEFKRRERGGRKRQIGILSQPDRLVDRPHGGPPARLLIVQALEPPHRLIEIVAIRFPGDVRQEIQSVGLVPQFGVHRLISPRFCERSTVSVTELTDTYRAK